MPSRHPTKQIFVYFLKLNGFIKLLSNSPYGMQAQVGIKTKNSKLYFLNFFWKVWTSASIMNRGYIETRPATIIQLVSKYSVFFDSKVCRFELELDPLKFSEECLQSSALLYLGLIMMAVSGLSVDILEIGGFLRSGSSVSFICWNKCVIFRKVFHGE